MLLVPPTFQPYRECGGQRPIANNMLQDWLDFPQTRPVRNQARPASLLFSMFTEKRVRFAVSMNGRIHSLASVKAHSFGLKMGVQSNAL